MSTSESDPSQVYVEKVTGPSPGSSIGGNGNGSGQPNLLNVAGEDNDTAGKHITASTIAAQRTDAALERLKNQRSGSKGSAGPNEINLYNDLPESVPRWLKESLAAIDSNGDGNLDKDEMIHYMGLLVKLKKDKENNNGELDYSGFPEAVREALAVWDTDGGGTVSVSELTAAAKAQKKMDDENRHLKKAVYGLVLMIFTLGLMNFVMGYLAVEAGKDARPVDSNDSSHRSLRNLMSLFDSSDADSTTSNSNSRRSLSITDYFNNILDSTSNSISGPKRVRLLSHDFSSASPQEGAMLTGDVEDGGVATGTAQTMDTFMGLAAIQRLQMIPPEAVGYLDSLQLPSMKGELKLGPFTRLEEHIDEFSGEQSKTFLFAGGSVKIVTPPTWPGSSCPPEPWLVVHFETKEEREYITVQDIESNGMYRCDPLSVRYCGESDEDYEMRKESYWFYNGNNGGEMDYKPMNPCKPSGTVLTLRGQPASPAAVSVKTMYDKAFYCGSSMQCTKDELNSYEVAMGIYPISTEMDLMKINDTADGMGYSEDTVLSLPDYNSMVNVSQMNDPTIAAMTISMWENFNETRRRRMQSDLINGNIDRILRNRRALQTLNNLPNETIVTTGPLPSTFNATQATEVAIKKRKITDKKFSTEITATAVKEVICQTMPGACISSEGIIMAADADKDGYLNMQEFENAGKKLSGTDVQDSGADKLIMKSENDVSSCRFFKNKESLKVNCKRARKEFSEDVGKNAKQLCRQMDRDNDGSVSIEECKLFEPLPLFEQMVKECGSNKPEREKKCLEDGVRFRDCKRVMEGKHGKFVSKFLCSIHDPYMPYASPDGGLMREEINQPFPELMRRLAHSMSEEDDHNPEDMYQGGSGPHRGLVADGGGYPRKLLNHKSLIGRLPFASRSYIHRRSGKIGRSRISALASSENDSISKQHNDAFHEQVFERFLNVPRMRILEARIEKKEIELRNRMLKRLGEHEYENWILERRLKATEKLRRRRILLAFDEEKDDPEVAHRKLQRIGRRLSEVSKAGANIIAMNSDSESLKSKKSSDVAPSTTRQLLESAGRKLVAEDDHEDRKLRHLLDNESATITAVHDDWIRELKIKRTSSEMRALMVLFHQGKRSRGSSRALQDSPSFDQVAHEIEAILSAPAGLDMVREWASNMLKKHRKSAKFQPPKRRILQLVKKITDEDAKEFTQFLMSQLPDDSAELAAKEAGDLPAVNEFQRYNKDGSTVEEVATGVSVRRLMKRYRVLQEIGERRRLEALSLNADNRRKLQSSDNFHRILAEHGSNLVEFRDSQIIDVAEAVDMYAGDMKKVKKLAKICHDHESDITSSMTRRMRRMMRELTSSQSESESTNLLNLDSHELRELSMADFEADAESNGPGGSGDIDITSMSCTPCMVLCASSPEHCTMLKMDPINAYEKEQGNPNWCSASYSNYMAIKLDEVAPPPIPSPTAGVPPYQPPPCADNVDYLPTGGMGSFIYTNTTTGDIKPFDINSCAGFPVRGNGQAPPGTSDMMDPMMGMPRRKLGSSNSNLRTRSLSEQVSYENSNGKYMFAHKKQRPLTYHTALLKLNHNGPNSKTGSSHSFDAHGRILYPHTDPTLCSSSTLTLSAQLACQGNGGYESPMALPSPTSILSAEGEISPNPHDAPYSFAQHTFEKMESLESCKSLPAAERELPLAWHGGGFDLDANNVHSNNLKIDTMGAGCMEQCQCHFLMKLPNNKEGIANVCDYEGEAQCGCMETKKKCHEDIHKMWESKSGMAASDEDGTGGDGGPIMPPVHGNPDAMAYEASMVLAASASTPVMRKLARRRALRSSRMGSFQYRRLLSHDVKKLIHESEMKRSRRRSLLIENHKFSKEMVDKLEKTEKLVHNMVGKKHKSIRVLTGKTGDMRRNLEFVENFQKKVKSYRQRRALERKEQIEKASTSKSSKGTDYNSNTVRQLQSGTTVPPSTYGPLGPIHHGSVSPAPYSPATYHPHGHGPGMDATPMPTHYHDVMPYDSTATYSTTVDPNNYSPTTNYPGQVPPIPPMNSEPLTVAPYYDPTMYHDPIDLVTSINHGFYDGATDTYAEVTSIRVEKKPLASNMRYDPSNPTATIDPFDYSICYSTYTPGSSSLPSNEICEDAMNYKPNEMGYSPMLTEEHHHGPSYCPQNPAASMVTPSDPYAMEMFGTDPAMGPVATMAPQWNLDGGGASSNLGVNLMFEQQPGTECLDGMIVDEIVMRNHNEEVNMHGSTSRVESHDPSDGPPRPEPNDLFDATRPAITPSTGMREHLYDHALEHMSTPCVDSPESCPSGINSPRNFTDGEAMLMELEAAFPAYEPGKFDRGSVKHPELAAELHRLEMRGGTTPGLEDRLFHAEMEDRHSPDIYETVTVSMPRGHCPPMIRSMDNRAPTLYETVLSSKRDQSDPETLTVGDCINFYEACQTQNSPNDPDSCRKITMIGEYVQKMNMMPDPMTPGELTRPVTPIEMEMILEAASPGARESMPVGQTTMPRDNYVAEQMIREEKLVSRPDSAVRMFEEHSRGRGEVEMSAMVRPSGIIEEMEMTNGRGKNTMEKKRKSKKMRQKNKKRVRAARRVKNKGKKAGRRARGMIDDMKRRYQNRLMRRARILMEKESLRSLSDSDSFSTNSNDLNKHLAAAYEEDFNAKVARMEKSSQHKEQTPKTQKAIRILQQQSKDISRQLRHNDRQLTTITLTDPSSSENTFSDPLFSTMGDMPLPDIMDYGATVGGPVPEPHMPTAFLAMMDLTMPQVKSLYETRMEILTESKNTLKVLDEKLNQATALIKTEVEKKEAEADRESMMKFIDDITLSGRALEQHYRKIVAIEEEKAIDNKNNRNNDMITYSSTPPGSQISDPSGMMDVMFGPAAAATVDADPLDLMVGNFSHILESGKMFDATYCSTAATAADCTDGLASKSECADFTVSRGKGYANFAYRSTAQATSSNNKAPYSFASSNTVNCCALRCTKSIYDSATLITSTGDWQAYKLDLAAGLMTLDYDDAYDIAHCMNEMQHVPPMGSLSPKTEMIEPKEYIHMCEMKIQASGAPGAVGTNSNGLSGPSSHDLCLEEFSTLASSIPDAGSVHGGDMSPIPAEMFMESSMGPDMGSVMDMSTTMAQCPSSASGEMMSITPPTTYNKANGMVVGGFGMRKLSDLRSLFEKTVGSKRSLKKKEKLMRRLEQTLIEGHTGPNGNNELFAIGFGRRRHRKRVLLDSPLSPIIGHQNQNSNSKSNGLNRRSLQLTTSHYPTIMMPGDASHFSNNLPTNGYIPMAEGESYQLSCDDQNLLLSGVSGPGQADLHQAYSNVEDFAAGDPMYMEATRLNMEAFSHETTSVMKDNSEMIDMYMGRDYDDAHYSMADSFDYPDPMMMMPHRERRQLTSRSTKNLKNSKAKSIKSNRKSKVQQLRQWYINNGLVDKKNNLVSNDHPKRSRKLQYYDYGMPDTTLPPALGISAWQPEMSTMSPAEQHNHYAAVGSMMNGMEMTTYSPQHLANQTYITSPSSTSTYAPPVLFQHAYDMPGTTNDFSSSSPIPDPDMGYEYDLHYNITAGSFEKIYTGANVSMIESHGNPEDFLASTNIDSMATADSEMLQSMEEMPIVNLNDTVIDTIMAQLGNEDGYIPSRIEAGYDCSIHGTSAFVVESPNLYDPVGANYGGHISQIDYGSMCEYRKDMQSKASGIEGMLLSIIKKKAQARVSAGIKTNVVRRILNENNGPESNVPSYLRKLLGIPQAWEVESIKRKLSTTDSAQRKLSDSALGDPYSTSMVVEAFYDQSATDMNEIQGPDMEQKELSIDDPACMFTPEQSASVEPFDELPSYLMGSTMDLGSNFKHEMEKIHDNYHKAQEKEYLKARKLPKRLQRMINIGMSLQEKKELLELTRDIFTTPEPGSDPSMIWSNSDPDQCTMLYEEHLGCGGLTWMSTDWSNQWNFDWSSGANPPEPRVDNSADTPHQKCVGMSRRFAQKYSGKKHRAMLKALTQALHVVGDWNTASAINSPLYYMQNNAGKPSATVLEGLCGDIFDKNTVSGATYSNRDYTRMNMDTNHDISAILGTSVRYPPAAGVNSAAKTNFVNECKVMFSDIVNMVPDSIWNDANGWGNVPSTQFPSVNFSRSKWDLDSIRRALLIELDLDYKQEWQMPEEKPVSTRLARCALRAVRENIPESMVEKLMKKMKKGQVKPERVVKLMLEPALERIAEENGDYDGSDGMFELNPMKLSEAMEMMSPNTDAITDECKEFCSEYHSWSDMMVLPASKKEAKPDWSGSALKDMAETNHGVSSVSCDVTKHCELYIEMAAPEDKMMMTDRMHTRRRLRERRERRRRMMEKRKLSKSDSVSETSDSDKESALRRKLQKEAEFWEERGVQGVIMAINGQKSTRISPNKRSRQAILKSRIFGRR